MTAATTYQYFNIDNYNILNTLFYLVVIPTILGILIALIIHLLNKKHMNKLMSDEYKILKCEVTHKRVFENDDGNASAYYLGFNCNENGRFEHEVKRNLYLCSTVHYDRYYLLIVPKKNNKYKLLEIFHVRKWHISPELNQVIEIIQKNKQTTDNQ